MKKLRDIFFVGLFIFLMNGAFFIFWWVFTDPSNYLWKDVSEQQFQLVQKACSNIFWIRFYTWAVPANLITLAFVLYYRETTMSICFLFVALLTYTVSRQVFDPYIGRNYIALFENQEVSNPFVTEPIKSAGKSAGPLLLEKIADSTYTRRAEAIKALGEIKYEPAVETLGRILLSSSESEETRGRCYIALKNIRSDISKKYLLLFYQLMLQNEKDREWIQRLEKENSY